MATIKASDSSRAGRPGAVWLAACKLWEPGELHHKSQSDTHPALLQRWHHREGGAAPKVNAMAGVLYKENFGENNSPWLLVIPSDLREEIFQACHDDPTSGHLGYSRTLARIREKYYWPKLPKTVHLYTRSCHECQRRKKPPTRPAGLLQPISPPTAPFQQIGMDLLGPFPPSTSGNRWIIVATDYLTRYAETKALPSGTAVEVAKFFIESIVLRHGAPEVLITDRGSSFMAQLTQEILRLSHTSHRRTTAYHPQTNGLTERLNKTIADMISMYVDVEHKTWDEVLPYVTFAYNTAVQETTGFTPFQLVHGRKVVAQRAEEVRQLARLLIQDQQRVDAGRYNLRRRDVHFQPGDRVWVWTPIRRRGLSEKLLKRYFGPYKVLRRLGELNYEVMPDGTRTSSRRPPRPEVVHVVRLKPYYAR
ncbi:DDE-type integrase/transposase/recombinase [Ixodes scapularis]